MRIMEIQGWARSFERTPLDSVSSRFHRPSRASTSGPSAANPCGPAPMPSARSVWATLSRKCGNARTWDALCTLIAGSAVSRVPYGTKLPCRRNATLRQSPNSGRTALGHTGVPIRSIPCFFTPSEGRTLAHAIDWPFCLGTPLCDRLTPSPSSRRAGAFMAGVPYMGKAASRRRQKDASRRAPSCPRH